MSDRQPWWRGAVIYQVYPRSFLDTNGDGIGDLPGVTARLDHIAGLGVDAIWLSPFFKSPQKDYGYDVEDYCDIDPMFGTLADADRLIEEAHRRGLKIVVDLVLSHTSNRHPWFLESRSDRTNPRADWNVWADAKLDGTPPNNWLSIFGGVAWEWETRRGQYYLHNFLKEQPDLNLHCPAVVPALLEIARFWLERGVDGFRLDALHCAVHDARLRDNPARTATEPLPGGIHEANPMARQNQIYNKGLPEVLPVLLEPLRELCDGYGDILLLGEIAEERALENAAAWSGGARGIHTAYTFDLLSASYTAAEIGGVVEQLEATIADGWPCWSLSNHDITRAPTRLGGHAPAEGLRKQLPILLACLRGTACLYQGEELGLDEAEVPYELLHDPVGITFWPLMKGRDGCRTPMPWQTDAPQAGFTTGHPWLPVPEAHRARAVDVQHAAPDSVLATLRRFLTWRREQPALVVGDWQRLDAPEPLLAFARNGGGQDLVCAFNLSGDVHVWRAGRPLALAGAPLPAAASIDGERVLLPAHAILIANAT